MTVKAVNNSNESVISSLQCSLLHHIAIFYSVYDNNKGELLIN